jgi:hypothetical protein
LVGSNSSPPSVADEDVPLKETVAESEVCRRNGRFGRDSFTGAKFECTAALTALSRGSRIFSVGVEDWADWVIVTEAFGVMGGVALGGLAEAAVVSKDVAIPEASDASGPADWVIALGVGATACALAPEAPSSFAVFLAEGLGFRRWRVVLVDLPFYKRGKKHVRTRNNNTHSLFLLLGRIKHA